MQEIQPSLTIEVLYDAVEEQAAKMVLKVTSALSAGSSVQLVFMAFIVW